MRLHIEKKNILTLAAASTVAVSELYCPPNFSLYYSFIPMDKKTQPWRYLLTKRLRITPDLKKKKKRKKKRKGKTPLKQKPCDVKLLCYFLATGLLMRVLCWRSREIMSIFIPFSLMQQISILFCWFSWKCLAFLSLLGCQVFFFKDKRRCHNNKTLKICNDVGLQSHRASTQLSSAKMF